MIANQIAKHTVDKRTPTANHFRKDTISTLKNDGIVWSFSHFLDFGYLRLHALLVRLTPVLPTTPDEILGVEATATTEDLPVLDRRFLRRLRQVEKLSPHQQRIRLATIDAFLAKVS